jgi:hypothetical protein
VFSLDEDWVTLNQMIKYYKYSKINWTKRSSEFIKSD